MESAFDLKKYVALQSNKILERVNQFDNKLYLEFGGKLFDDNHASRVLPGFEPDSKIKMLYSIKDKVEIVIAINAHDIMISKVRKDLNITYEGEVFRLLEVFAKQKLYVGSVVITQYQSSESVDRFIFKLNNLGVKTFKHYVIESYPYDTDVALSDNGFGKNEYIETTRPIVVVTAPGPGSGKMATCLSQLYHENVRGIKAGYAKFETFPVWNLSLDNLVNLAYEAATADLNDINMIDTFHLLNHGTLAVSYNRDLEVFPLLKVMFEKIYGESPYLSPTDMGVNMIGFCINDEEKVNEAAKQEIIRRYLNSLVDFRNGYVNQTTLDKLLIIMGKAQASPFDRVVVEAARKKNEIENVPCSAMELPDGRIVTGKASPLFSSVSAAVINALKTIANIDDELDLIPRNIILPIIDMKENEMKAKSASLHIDEVLIALSISATSNPLACLAMKKLQKLKGSELHCTHIISQSDARILRKLKINFTTDPNFNR